jgi:hypothetical protein
MLSSRLKALVKQELPQLLPIEPPSQVGFRVLVLDDQMFVNELYPSFLGIKNQGWGKYKRQISHDPPLSLECLYNKYLDLEVMICRSLAYAKNYLLNIHFDICLVDIDFRKDPEYPHGNHPRLGGLLYAIALVTKTKTCTSIFTALGEELREYPDYSYLRQLAEKQVLGNLYFEEIEKNQKQLEVILKKAFYNYETSSKFHEYSWCKKVLPLLKPTASSASACAQHLFSGDEPGYLELQEPREGVTNQISNELIRVLVPKDNRKEVAGLLLKIACGHALVRYLFCRLAHGINTEKALLGFLEPKKQKQFDRCFEDACVHFEIANPKEFRKKILEGGKKYYRINLLEIFPGSGIINNQPIFLYGLWKNPDDDWENLKNEIASLVVQKGTDVPIQMESWEIDQKGQPVEQEGWGRVIKIWANREGTDYRDQPSQGGTIDQIKLLRKVAAKLEIVGVKGTLNLSEGRWIKEDKSGTNLVYIRVTVMHIPELENENA